MSYIRESGKCSNCGTELKYAWLFPDGRFERIPQDCQISRSNSTIDGFDISVKCSKCSNIFVVRFDKQGKLNGHR